MLVCVTQLSYNTGTLHTTVSSQDKAADAQRSKKFHPYVAQMDFYAVFDFFLINFSFSHEAVDICKVHCVINDKGQTSNQLLAIISKMTNIL